jgi:hypothetical protein
MTKVWQVYYDSILGAIGAIFAWLLLGLIDTTTWNIHLANLLTGAGVGLFIGSALGMVDGLLVKRSFKKTIIGLLGGATAGVISGMIGLFLGGVIFNLIEGGFIARILGWMVFGAFLGLGQGLINWNKKLALYGFLGGFLAGLIGGALYEIFTQLFLQQSADAQIFLSAFGLMLIGISVGIIIPLTVTIIGGVMSQRGLIVYLNGPRKGTEIEIIGGAILGSSDACDIYIPDNNIEKQQAQISLGSEGFMLSNFGSSQSFYLGQSLIRPGNSDPISSGSTIQMGNIQLLFKSW